MKTRYFGIMSAWLFVVIIFFSPLLNAQTPCIPPVSSYSCQYMWISNVTTSGGVSDFNNTTSCSGNSYDDYSSTYIASNYQGATTTLSFSSATDYSYALAFSVWIDFDKDGTFSGTEQVISNANASASFTFTDSFVVPVSAAIGTYIMRIRADYYGNGAPIDPCTTLIYGETEDYAFTVLPTAQPSTINLTFNVDMTQPINAGDFYPGSDLLYVTGSFANANNPVNGWDTPGTGKSVLLTDVDMDNIYSGTVNIDTNYGSLKYKYFKNASWNYGDQATGDRTITIGATDYTTNDIWVYKPNAVINRASAEPVIDGLIDAVWAEAPKYNIDKNFQSEAPTLGVSGQTYFQTLWVPSGLYVLVNVTDDEWYPGYESGLKDWVSDKIEVYVDVNSNMMDGLGIGYPGHYQFAPAPAPNVIDGSPVDLDGFTYAYRVPNDASYVFELFVPLTKLLDNNGNIVSTAATIGFDVTVVDLESGGTTRRRAVWNNVGNVAESYQNMDDCGLATFISTGEIIYVNSISVSSAGNVSAITTDNGTLQMSASASPTNATYQNVTWSVINGTGKASINFNGLLTAIKDGTVTVVATSRDGSNITGTKQITLSNQNVTLKEVNLIKNGGFSTDGNLPQFPWNFNSPNGGTASVIGGVCTMVPAAAAEQWQLSVNQESLDIYNDTTYILTFTAWADANRVVGIDFEDDAAHSYERFGDSPDGDAQGGKSEWQINLSSTPTIFERTVTMRRLDGTSSRKFQIMASASLETVYFDNISLLSLGDYNLIHAANLFAGGTGTQADPYQIATAEQLNNVRRLLGPENTDVYFSQVADIDLGVSPWADGEGWEPIGNKKVQFYGNYNGNSYTISGLTIYRPDSVLVGLFGYAMEASFSNMGLVNVNITGNQRVAPLVARLELNGYIVNCYATGNVTGQRFTAGLVANLYDNSILENSFSTVNVQIVSGTSVNELFGGLVSRLISSTIRNSFATVNIGGIGTYIGGLVGFATYGTINNSYSTGMITGWGGIGGLVGRADSSNLVNCYSIGKVVNVSGSGGLVGEQLGSTANNCYWNIETSGQPTSALGEPRNTNQLLYASNFSGWDFSSPIWIIYNGTTYPFLTWQGTPGAFNYPPSVVPPSNLAAIPHNGYISLSWQTPSVGGVSFYYIYRNGSLYTSTTATNFDDVGLSNYTWYSYKVSVYNSIESTYSNEVSTFAHSGFAGGDGTTGNPYLISNAGELYTVRLYPSAYFKQIADIDLSTSQWNSGEGWEPIYNFTGSYNGDNYAINYLYINRPTQDDIGLFGSFEGATLDNVIINYATITGRNFVGILTGQASNCFLTNIKTNGTINGGEYTGGISASTYKAAFNKCSSSGNISSTGIVAGGISGDIYGNSSVINSYSNMNINTTSSIVGGLAGSVVEKSTINNCYFTGSVAGSDIVGGIAGLNDSSDIKYCYSIGSVSGNGDLGGLAGLTRNSGTVANSYWNKSTSGQSTSSGGGQGRTTAEMQYPYSNTYVGWDFTNIWADDNNGSINNGYPYLRVDAASQPTVTTYEAESITSSSATVRGNVTSDGGLTVTERGIVWSTTTNPTIDSNIGKDVDAAQGLGEFSGSLTNLTPSNKYFVRAYAINALGTSYGNEINFTTLSSGGTLTITGKTTVCQGAKSEAYSIGSGSYTNITWNITNGTIVSGDHTNNIKVDWNNSGSSGKVEVQANSNSVPMTGSMNVAITQTTKPDIYVKGPGRSNILICKTSGANSYQWYKDNNAIATPEGKKQYYVAKTNTGSYYVGINTGAGCVAYSDTKNIGNQKSLNLYPNPATVVTTLSYEDEAKGIATIKIVDVYGKTIRQIEKAKTDFQLQEDIPLDGLYKGVYMIEITIDGVIMDNQRFIIN